MECVGYDNGSSSSFAINFLSGFLPPKNLEAQASPAKKSKKTPSVRAVNGNEIKVQIQTLI